VTLLIQAQNCGTKHSTLRFLWLARMVDDIGPDVWLDGGDSQDFLGLCSHERDETWKGKLKPILARELEYAAQMYSILNKSTHKCRKIITLGNHEHRLWTYENENPAVHEIPTTIYTKDILEASGWEWHKYGEYVTVGGVRFTHCPFNGMGKPVGGENACKQIAEKSTQDTVFGHTHFLSLFTAHKFGYNKSVTAFNGGSFMQNKYVGNYAKNSRKGHWYGAHLITTNGEGIDSIKSWSMAEIEQKYGG